eukprot:TRINITY_DN2078_c0_g1_i1.p1 TRINITY_DN2078_c0_g1~~TRINITY_DN2078_c0_g1_i1.p1  ORF type:complete len:152 (-),score=30.18 TRINITY_DN2078_c0_g1_i1:178-633(-)
MFRQLSSQVFRRDGNALMGRVSHSTPTLRALFSASSRATDVEKEEIFSEIEKLISSDECFVFMKGIPSAPMCGFSKTVVNILEAEGIKSFKSFNVLSDEQIRDGVKRFSEWPTIPQVYIGGEFVGGCDIMLNLHQSGELNGMLKKKGLVEE